MLSQRLLVAAVLLPLVVVAIVIGGWVLAIIIAAALGYAAWEYYCLFRAGQYRPSAVILVLGTAGFVLIRQLYAFTGSDLLLALLLMITMTVQVIAYEKGSQTAALDFLITVGGVLYVGWLGGYMVSLRSLPEGMWWLLMALLAVVICDAAAYFVGRRFGRHKLSQRVSPKKSWEGFLGGVVFTCLGTMLLAILVHLQAPGITLEKGLILGLAISILSPLGDLGESLLKRSFGVKDSSHLLPGHGGLLDRIDSWLWTAPISYYLIVYLWI